MAKITRALRLDTAMVKQMAAKKNKISSTNQNEDLHTRTTLTPIW